MLTWGEGVCNLETLRQLNDLLGALDIDWEAAIADLLGDVPAHIIGDVIRKQQHLAPITKSVLHQRYAR